MSGLIQKGGSQITSDRGFEGSAAAPLRRFAAQRQQRPMPFRPSVAKTLIAADCPQRFGRG
jgi:hypothetical protein